MSCAWDDDKEMQALLDPQKRMEIATWIDEEGREVLKVSVPQPEPEPKSHALRNFLFAMLMLLLIFSFGVWLRLAQ